jgi:hypothetical protein
MWRKSFTPENGGDSEKKGQTSTLASGRSCDPDRPNWLWLEGLPPSAYNVISSDQLRAPVFFSTQHLFASTCWNKDDTSGSTMILLRSPY